MVDIGILQDILLNPDALAEILAEELDNNSSTNKKQISNRPSAPRNRDRSYALREMDYYLSDAEFTRMFRLNRIAFTYLLELIALFVSPKINIVEKFRIIERSVPPKTKLAITLRWLAGGSYLDICFAFGLNSGSFFKHNGVLWIMGNNCSN